MVVQAYVYAGLAALELAGGYFAAQNIRDTAALNREIADMNAEFAELDAYDAEVAGYTQEAKYQSVIDQTLSEQQTILTAQDIDVNYGSIGEIREESEFIGELNKMEIEKQAQEQALGYTRQARDYRFKASLGSAQAESKASRVLLQSAVGAVKSGATGYERSP